MTKVVVIEPEELQSMIDASVKRALDSKGNPAKGRDSQTEHFTVKQASEFLDLAPQTIYGLTSRNEIPHYKRGKKLYFLKAELERWILENRKPQIPTLPLKKRPDK